MNLDWKPRLATQKRSLTGLASIVLVSLSVCAGPAHATLLEGHVERSTSAKHDMPFSGVGNGTTPGDATGAQSRFPNAPIMQQPANPALNFRSQVPRAATAGAAPAQNASNQAPYTVAHARPSVGSMPPMQPPNSFPLGFEGKWQCVTKVIDSAVDSIAVGTELTSEVNFVRLPSGRVVARWLQPGWTETQASAVKWNESEARVDRTSYYFGEGMNGSWGSRARDQFVQTGSLSMTCKSYVDQYLDGNYLGRYRTISMLTREGSLNAIAQTEKPAYEPKK